MGALSGFVFSGGNAINVSFGSTIAQSGIVNNYLTHADVAELEQDLARCERENGGSCEDQALADIIEKVRTRSSQRDAGHVATCARDMACVNDLLQDVATNSLGEWNDIQTDYWEVYTGLSDVIRPGELVSIHQSFLLEQVPLQNAFALDNCGGVWSPACENAYQLAAVENLLMVGTLTGVGGLTVGAVRALVARASVACGRDPRCWAGFLGREVGEEALSEVAAGGALVTGTVTFADEIASAVRVAYRDTILAAPNTGERIVIRTNSAGESVVSIQGKEMSIHESRQATTRGISNENIANAMDQQPFRYVQNGQTLQGYYDASSNVFVAVGDRITTVIRPSNPMNYLNNLRNRQ